MQSPSLRTVAGAAGIATFLCFLVGIPFMAVGGVQVLIPETGKNGLDWLADANDASGLFFAGAWLVILGGLAGLVSLVAPYDVLRPAGPILIFAPVLAVVGLTLVTISHLIPIAMAYRLAPGYANAEPTTQSCLAVTSDTLAALGLVLNYVGDVLGRRPALRLGDPEDVGIAALARLARVRRRLLRGLARPLLAGVERRRRADHDRLFRFLPLHAEHRCRAAARFHSRARSSGQLVTVTATR